MSRIDPPTASPSTIARLNDWFTPRSTRDWPRFLLLGALSVGVMLLAQAVSALIVGEWRGGSSSGLWLILPLGLVGVTWWSLRYRQNWDDPDAPSSGGRWWLRPGLTTYAIGVVLLTASLLVATATEDATAGDEPASLVLVLGFLLGFPLVATLLVARVGRFLGNQAWTQAERERTSPPR